MSYRTILLEQSGRVATITLNLPEKLNPIDLEVGREIARALDEIERIPSTEIVVFRGAGRAFTAGGDIGEGHLRYHMLRKDGPSHPEEMDHMTRFFVGLFERIERLDRIVIGVIHGVVAGGSQRLSRLVGPLRAKEMLLTGRFLKAREAYEIGLATYCVANEALEGKLAETIETLLAKSYAGRVAMKQFVNHGLQMPLPAAIEMERLYALHHLTTHPDSLEGLLAFADKRKPSYLPRDVTSGTGAEG